MKRFGFIVLLCICVVASGFSLYNHEAEGQSSASILIFKKRLNKKYDTGYHLDVTYPEVHCRNVDQGYQINRHIHQLTSGAISDFTKQVQKLYPPSEGYHYMNLDYTVHYTDSYMISVRFKRSAQFVGYKQNPDFSTTFNYDLRQDRVVHFNDLFQSGANYSKKIANILFKQEGIKISSSALSKSTKFCMNSHFLTLYLKSPSKEVESFHIKWSALATVLDMDNSVLASYVKN